MSLNFFFGIFKRTIYVYFLSLRLLFLRTSTKSCFLCLYLPSTKSSFGVFISHSSKFACPYLHSNFVIVWVLAKYDGYGIERLKFRICFGAIFLATLAVISATFERSSLREDSDSPLGLKIEPEIVSLLTGLLMSLTVRSQFAMLNSPVFRSEPLNTIVSFLSTRWPENSVSKAFLVYLSTIIMKKYPSVSVATTFIAT